MILDTNAISDLFQANESLLELLGNDDHQLPVIALGEYRYGLARSRLRKELDARLRQLEAIWTVLPIDRETTRVYADVRNQLRIGGTPIPENDVWIAALGLQYELPIASRDDHFDQVSGVKRLRWTTE